MNNFEQIRRLVIALGMLSLALSARAQGPLNPPGPPATAMKTLDQVEPRTDLQASPLPAGVTTDENFHFIINQPGSYYLSANLVASKANAIRIDVANVTLDLKGFEISRNATAENSVAIDGLEEAREVSVRNGSITRFAFAIRVHANSRGWALRDLTVSRCTAAALGDSAINAGSGAVIESCRAFGNASTAIEAGINSVVRDCSVTNNGNLGIRTDYGATITNCSAYGNKVGISGGAGSTITDSAAVGNSIAGLALSSGTITNCAAWGNQGRGISVEFNASVKDCSSQNNRGDGIRAFQGCYLSNNVANGNGGDEGDGAGIHVTGQANRIDGNHVHGNDRGIDVDDVRNFIVRNTARTNTTNYTVKAGNRIARIVVVATNAADIGEEADSGSSDGFTGVDPWSNFSF